MRKVWRFSDPVFCGLTPKHPVAMVLGNAQNRKSAKSKKASSSTDRRVTPKSTIMIQQAGQRCPVALRAAVASNEPKRPRPCRHSRKCLTPARRHTARVNLREKILGVPRPKPARIETDHDALLLAQGLAARGFDFHPSQSLVEKPASSLIVRFSAAGHLECAGTFMPGATRSRCWHPRNCATWCKPGVARTSRLSPDKG